MAPPASAGTTPAPRSPMLIPALLATALVDTGNYTLRIDSQLNQSVDVQAVAYVNQVFESEHSGSMNDTLGEAMLLDPLFTSVSAGLSDEILIIKGILNDAELRQLSEDFESGSLSDDEKEIFMRRQSLIIMKETTIFTLKFLFIFLILYLLYLMTSNLFSIPAEAFVESMFSLPVLLILTVLAVFYGLVRNAISKRL